MAKKTTKTNTEATRTVENPGGILKNPRITEKTSKINEGAVYTFDVARDTTKPEIKKAINMLYKVNPLKVRVATIPTKNVIVRGKRGTRGGGKKAYVYLKKGETIEIA